MTTRQEKRAKRTQFTYQLETLETQHFEVDGNTHCDGCKICNQIRAIGKEIDNFAKESRDSSLPEHLNIEVYRHLRDEDWTKQRIRRHYGLSNSEFYFFLNEYKKSGINHDEIEEEIVIEKPKFSMTPDEYREMKSIGVTDKAIIRRFGITTNKFVSWKKEHGFKTQYQPRKGKVKS